MHMSGKSDVRSILYA